LAAAVETKGHDFTSFVPIEAQEMYVPHPVKIIDGFFRVDRQHHAVKWDGEPVKIKVSLDV